jgi:hypothetical protein
MLPSLLQVNAASCILHEIGFVVTKLVALLPAWYICADYNFPTRKQVVCLHWTQTQLLLYSSFVCGYLTSNHVKSEPSLVVVVMAL